MSSKRFRTPERKYRKRRRRTFPRKPLTAGSLGKKLLQRFKYATKITLNPGTGTPAGHVFSANGLYDPDITGVGHQPMGFDQLVGVFYQHYTVLSSLIKVTFFSSDGAIAAGAGIVTVEPNGSTTLDTDIYDILERGKSVSRPYNNSSAGAYAVNTISMKCDLNKFLSQNVMQEDANAGTSSANPTEQVYWHINAQGITTGQDASPVYMLVEIWYDAVLHEPKDLIGS